MYLFPVSVENIQESSNNFYEHNVNCTGMHMEGTLPQEWFCYYNCSQSCSSWLSWQFKRQSIREQNSMGKVTRRESLLWRDNVGTAKTWETEGWRSCFSTKQGFLNRRGGFHMEETCCWKTWPLMTVFVGGISGMYLGWAAVWAVRKACLSCKCFIPPKIIYCHWFEKVSTLQAFEEESYQCPNSWYKVSTANVSMQACVFDHGVAMWGFCSFSEK